MRRLAIVGLAALIAGDRASAGSPASLPIQTFHLPNGLTVLVVEDRRVPLVSVVSLHRFGSAQDPPGRPGLSHLVEHMLVEGYRVQARGDQPVASVRIVGRTGPEFTFYESDCRKGEVGLALWAEAMRMTAFDRRADMERVLAAARDSARNEDQEYEDRQTRRLVQAAAHELYPEGHPFRQIFDGQSATLDSATITEMASFHRRHYRPDNTTVAVVGDVDAGEVQELAQRYLGPLPASEAPGTAIPSPPARRGRTLSLPGPEPRVLIVYPVSGDSAPDEPALTVLRALLGSSLGRLNQHLVHDRSVLRSLSVSLQQWSQGGWLAVELQPRDGQSPDQAVAAFDQELGSLHGRWPDTPDLIPIKAGLEFDRVSSFQSLRDRSFALLRALRIGGSARSLWTRWARLNAVTAPQLRAAMDHYLDRGRRLVLKLEPGASPAATPSNPASAPAPAAELPARPRIAIPDPKGEGVFLSALNLPDLPVESFRLSNGLAVVLAPTHDVPRVDGTLVVRAGIDAVPLERLGLAQATTTLLMRGTRSRPLAAFTRDASSLGGGLWSEADWTAALVGFESLRSSLPQTLDLWAEVLREPVFEEGELELWRQQRLAKRAADARDPDEASFDVLRSQLFPPSSPWCWPPGGTARTSASVRRDDLRGFHFEHYHPGNATLIVAGDVQAAQLAPMLEKALADWLARPASSTPPAPPPSPRGAGGIFLVDVPGKTHASVRMGTLGVPDTSIDRAAQHLLADYLEIRLMRSLRAAGLAYMPRVSSRAWTRASVFDISASVEAAKVGQAVERIRDELRLLREHAWRVDSVQARAIQGLFRRWETIDGIERTLVIGSLFDLSTATLSRQAAAYDRPDGRSQQRLAARLLAPERLVLVVAGDRKVIEPQLAKLGKVTVLPPIP